MAEIKIDRQVLREIVTKMRPKGENDWCVACGAGAASAKLDYPADLVKEAGQQFLDPKALREFANNIKDIGGEQAWCVACGAGAAASPLDRVLPGDIPDADIDAFAKKLIAAVKVGD